MTESEKSQDEIVNGGLIAAKILNRLPIKQKEKLLRNIAEVAPALVAKIEENLVSLSDISKLPKPSLQALVQKLEPKDLVLMAQGVDEETKISIVNAMSERKQALVKEEVSLLKEITGAEVAIAKEKAISALEEIKQGGAKKGLSRAVA